MNDLEKEWMDFTEYNEDTIKKTENKETFIKPKCSDIYISTKTKICYLNKPIDIFGLYWKLPLLDYHTPAEGIIKKTVKINCENAEETNKLEEKIQNKRFK